MSEPGEYQHFLWAINSVFGEECSKAFHFEVSGIYSGFNGASELNRWQLEYVAELLKREYPYLGKYMAGYFGSGDAVLVSVGKSISGKGIF